MAAFSAASPVPRSCNWRVAPGTQQQLAVGGALPTTGGARPPPTRHPRRQLGLQGLQHTTSSGRSSCRCCCSAGEGTAAAAVSGDAAAASVFSTAQTMQDVYDVLADRVQSMLKADDPSQTLLIGVAGVPGSGKSSLVNAVCSRLNQRGTPAVVVPMDGFHYFRRQLDQMPDPQLAHARRGAEWTFDARAYHACLKTIKETGEVLAPSFDHGVGDPAPGDIAVGCHHRVVLSEGNYLLLAAEPWWQLQQLFDDTWFIDVSVDEAMQRVFQRQTGNGLAAEVSRWRISANDRPNAEQVQTTRGRAALVVPTLPLE